LFHWFIVAESTVRWFVVREKHCWMTADSADPAKRTGWRKESVQLTDETSVLMKPEQKSQEALQHFYLSYPVASSTLHFADA
jgi:hypothetical protein